MHNIKRKILYLFSTVIFLIFINTISNAKYITDNTIDIANLNIDRTKPKIEVISIKNSNNNSEKYASKIHMISIEIKVNEKNIQENNFNEKNIEIKLDNNMAKAEYVKINKLEQNTEEIKYRIDIKGIDGNGVLNIGIKEGAIIDKSGLKNEIKNINTGISIDNVAPTGKFKEIKIEDGKVNAEITLNEQIKSLNGWTLSSDKLKITKEFTNNISYELPITDYAGNTTNIKIDITQATYINVVYASHNSCVGWSFGYGNYDVAGKEAIEEDPEYKTEALAFNIDGNIAKDFVQANAYVYTYWGEGSYARCTTQGLLYNYGYNPQKGLFKSMASKDLVTINNKKYFQFGGSGVNGCLNKDINGNNPIPENVAWQFRYGISGISMKLKDYSQFSIIYQILVNDVGWIKTCSDGQECTYNHKKPMSAFRIALVPKSEKQYVIDKWNKDVGTMRIK